MEDVEWKDSVFAAGTSVTGGQDFTLFRVFFGRAFDTSDRHDMGVGAGFHRAASGHSLSEQLAFIGLV